MQRRFPRVGGFERAAVLLAGVALVVFAVIVWVGGAPVAWLLLGFCGVTSAATLAIQLRHARFFEPLTVITAFALVSLVARALQLFIGAKDLLSFYPTGDPTDQYLRLETSETAQFVTQLLKEPLEPALTKAIGAVAIFVALVVVGYLLPWGPGLGERLGRVGRRVGRPPNVRALVLVCLAIAALGQTSLLIKVGGPGEALDTSFRHAVLRGGLVDHFLVGFGVVGVLIWLAWSPPRSKRARVAFGLVTLEMCAFFVLAGSRTRVVLLLGMLAIAVHYLWRRWRPIELVGALIVVILFATAVLGIRQATADKTTGEALGSASTYIERPQGILNDLNEFDYLFEATNVIGSSDKYRRPADFQYGNGFWQAVHPFVPGSIDPNKPESRDQEFRKIIWGDTQGEGRPYTIIGDFWNDFGFFGVVVGSLVFGLLSRAMLGLVSPARDAPGQEFRVILYAMGLTLVYIAVSTTYSVTVGFLVIFGLPLLLALFAIRPVVDRAAARLGRGARTPEKASIG
jgi:oligosaccharide repeat unit polymerase